MYPEPTPIIPAAERTAQQWVDYYLQIENDVLAGKDVTFDGGRRVVLENLAEIRKARYEWERRAKLQKTASCGKSFGCGGLTYKTADMS